MMGEHSVYSTSPSKIYLQPGPVSCYNIGNCRVTTVKKGRIGYRSLGPLLPKAANEIEGPEQENISVVRRRGGGGPWRAYMHVHSLGCKLTASKMRELATQYRSLSVAERQRYELIGAEGSKCHREGQGSFPAGSARAKRRQRGHASENNHLLPVSQAAVACAAAIMRVKDSGPSL